MPTTRIDATAEAERTAYILGAGANKVVAVNYPHNDAVSYIEKASANGTQTYKTGTLPGGVAVVTAVQIVAKGKTYSATGSQKCFWEFNGGATANCGVDHNPGDAWTEWSHSGISRPGGGSWTVADIGAGANCLRMGMAATNDATGGVRLTSLWLNVTFIYAGGVFAIHVAQWLPPILAVASHCLSKLEISRILSILRTRPSSDEDFARIIEAFRRRPAWV